VLLALVLLLHQLHSHKIAYIYIVLDLSRDRGCAWTTYILTIPFDSIRRDINVTIRRARYIVRSKTDVPVRTQKRKKHRNKKNWIENRREKKRSERRKHCALAVARRSQTFSRRRRPPSRGAQDGKNLISWRWSLPLPTNPVWWRSMHTLSSYRGNRPTNKQTPTSTDRTDYNTLRR